MHLTIKQGANFIKKKSCLVTLTNSRMRTINSCVYAHIINKFSCFLNFFCGWTGQMSVRND